MWRYFNQNNRPDNGEKKLLAFVFGPVPAREKPGRKGMGIIMKDTCKEKLAAFVQLAVIFAYLYFLVKQAAKKKK